MYQIDVKRPPSYVLQTCANDSLLSEVLLVMPEIHKHHSQQDKARQCQWNNGPGHTQKMPLLGVQESKDDNNDNRWKEPTGVHQSLGLIPVSAYDIAIKEKGEIHKQLTKAGIVHKVTRSLPVALRPREVIGLIASFVTDNRNQEKYRYRQP